MCGNKVRSKLPSETRKIRKPLMEKKRRARINDCLEELKRILLKNKKESLPESRPSKLEKADILEQTVDLLKRLTDVGSAFDNRRGDSVPADVRRGAGTADFRQGCQEAVETTRRLIDNYENLPPKDKRLLSYYLFPSTDKTLSSDATTGRVLIKTKEDRKERVWRPW